MSKFPAGDENRDEYSGGHPFSLKTSSFLEGEVFLIEILDENGLCGVQMCFVHETFACDPQPVLRRQRYEQRSTQKEEETKCPGRSNARRLDKKMRTNWRA